MYRAQSLRLAARSWLTADLVDCRVWHGLVVSGQVVVPCHPVERVAEGDGLALPARGVEVLHHLIVGGFIHRHAPVGVAERLGRLQADDAELLGML